MSDHMVLAWSTDEAVLEKAECGGAVTALLRYALESEHVPVRWKAAEALGSMGPEAKEAIPALAKALRDMSFQARAAEALSKMGPEAVPVLIEALGDESVPVRCRAAEALRDMTGEFPALYRNTRRILASIKMLELNLSDIVDLV